MLITLNNNPETLDPEKLTITSLLQVKNYTFKMLIVKVNGKLIPKDEYGETWVQDGDDVIVLHLISGG